MSLRIVPPVAAAPALAASGLGVGSPVTAAPATPLAAPAAAPARPAPEELDERKAATPPHHKPERVPHYHYHAHTSVPARDIELTALDLTPPVTAPQHQSASLQDYGERLVKLIPSEVVGIYLVGVGVIPATAKIPVTVWAIVCLGLVVLARAYATKEPALNLPPQWKAVVISSVSFVIWVYTIPGPFQTFGLAVPYVGSLAILVWTFVVPYFYTGT